MLKWKEVLKQISVMLITASAVFICALFGTYLFSLDENAALYGECNPQDFQFRLKEGESAEALSVKYGFEFETSSYKVVYEGENTFRIVPNVRTIDLPYYMQGNAPRDGELAMDANYAARHKISVGNTFGFGGKNYVISGIVALPDAVSPQVADNGKAYQPDTQAILLLTMQDYSMLPNNERSVYSAVFTGNASSAIKAEMKEDKAFSTLQFSEDNLSIGLALSSKKMLFTMIISLTGCILGAVAAITLYLAICAQMQRQSASLGILKALGYSKWRLSVSYAKSGVSVLLGAIAGYFLAFFLFPLTSSMLNVLLLLPQTGLRFYPVCFILLTLVPACVFAGIAVLIAARKLSLPALQLIQNRNERNLGRIASASAGRRQPKTFLKATSKAVVLNHLTAVFFVLFAGFAFCGDALLAITMAGIPSGMQQSIMESVHYQSNERYLLPKEAEDTEDRTTYYAIGCKIEFKGTQIESGELIALNDSTRLLRLTDEKGKSIDISDSAGIVINRWMQTKLGVKAGDMLTVNCLGTQYEMEISIVEQSIYGANMYCSFDFLKKYDIIQEENQTLRSGAYRGSVVPFRSEEHLFVITKDDLRQNVLAQQDSYVFSAVVMGIVALVLGVICLLLALYTLMKTNQKYIGMMKAYGYQDRECCRALFRIPRFLAYLGGLIGIAYSYIICAFVFQMVSKGSDMVIVFSLNFWHILIVAAAFAAVYEIILRIYHNKTKKIRLQTLMTE